MLKNERQKFCPAIIDCFAFATENVSSGSEVAALLNPSIRMKYIQLLNFTILMTFGWAQLSDAATQNHLDRPNIVLILIDDLGWKDVGYAGSTFYDTPHIDRLAAGGMRFNQAYAASMVCTPSRGAIFSGKYPARTKLTTVFNGPAGPDDRLHPESKYRGENDQHFEAPHRHALPKSEVIFAQALAEGGYATGFFGKWHCGECPGYYPDARGFEVAKGYRRKHGVSYGHFGEAWVSGNFANLPDPAPDEFIAETLTDQCVQFIESNKELRFLAVLSHYIVHSPATPMVEKIGKYKARKADDQDAPNYAALVESVDDSVGRVLKALKDSGLERNTLVIFTSDNGGLTMPGYTSNFPLMGGKGYPFEAGTRVPFVAHWPGTINPGASDERIIGTDIYPTMLAAAGLPIRPMQHVDGVDLMPIFVGDAQELPSRPLIFHYPHYTHATGPFSSIILDDWKLIRFYNDETGAYLLYNLADDPCEQTNLSAAEPQRCEQLAKRLSQQLAFMNAEMPRPNPAVDLTADVKRKHLQYSLGLAIRERQRFSSRRSLP